MSKIKRIEINHKQIFMPRLEAVIIDAKKDLLDFTKCQNSKSLNEEEILVYINGISRLLCNETNSVLFNFLYNIVLDEYRAMKMAENQLTLL